MCTRVVRARVVLGIFVALFAALVVSASLLFEPNAPPSAAQCARLWNRRTNLPSQAAVRSFDVAVASGWDTKAGYHCSLTFFTAPAHPWRTFVIWLEDPAGLPPAFHRDIGGDRYGRGELGAEQPRQPNTLVRLDGTVRLTG